MAPSWWTRPHRDYVIERVMVRGTWEAMRWLRRTYPRKILATSCDAGVIDCRRDRAYWGLIAGIRVCPVAGGSRPAWAG